MSKKRKKKSVYSDDQIEELTITLRMELKLMAFAAVKAIVDAKKSTSGEMPCPLCDQPLRYRVAKSNGHLAAKCSREDCLNAME